MMPNQACRKVVRIIFVTILMGGRLPSATESFVLSPRTIVPSGGALFWSSQVEVEAADNVEQDVPCSYVVSEVSGPLASPRKWLEHCESIDGREGAYTVVRCDFVPSSNVLSQSPPRPSSWRIWGERFHTQRLLSSFQSLISNSMGEGNVSIDEVSDEILTRTEGVISSLLEAAAKDWSSSGKDVTVRSVNENSYLTLMLTILWVPVGNKTIYVRGHGYHTGQLVTVAAHDYNNPPITASVASSGDDLSLEQWPNRYGRLPCAKLSSWCRRRTPLETQFKKCVSVIVTNDDDNSNKNNKGEDDIVKVVVDEVLLTRKISLSNGEGGEKEEEELLEGLTSNVFILYRDGSLRTPPSDGILSGYARHLVLECAAKECGKKVMQVPILLSEASQWKEVFVTSSIRLVSPVKFLVVQQQQQPQHVVEEGTSGGSEGKDRTTILLWKESSDQTPEPFWKQVHLKIMERGGQAA